MLAVACTTGRKEAPTADKADSLPAMRLALLPNDDCLPFYYAAQSGLFDTLGLHVRIDTYFSQFDADTALLGQADAGYTDSCRIAYYHKNGKELLELMPTRGRWALVASGNLRIRKLPHLKKRMVAAARHSASDWLCRQMAAEANLPYEALYHPQINDWLLRTGMLDGNQVETAMLPEPFATQAGQKGHRRVWNRESTLGRIVTRRKNFDADALLRAYKQASDSLNKYGINSVRKILSDIYRLDGTAVDSFILYKY